VVPGRGRGFGCRVSDLVDLKRRLLLLRLLLLELLQLLQLL
jgi:hypothetical protein